MKAAGELRRRGVLFWGGLGVAVLAVAFVAGRPSRDGPPLDPRSTGPLGTKALVVLLDELGAEVDIADAPGEGVGETALVLADTLTGPQRADLQRWVEAGGTLLVADPGSPLIEADRREPFEDSFVLPRRCDVPALAEVDRIEPSSGVPLVPRAGATGCFPVLGGSFVVVEPHGAGTVVAVGGAATFINRVIGDEDNAALAASILAPRPGTRVTVLRSAPVGAGDRSLVDLIGHRVRGAGWQLVIAFLLVALWRGRRLGRPVADPQPVEIPGSELVVAVGHLWQQGRHRDRAAAVLASDLRRTLAERLGLPRSTPDDVLARVAESRTGVSAAAVEAALAGRAGADDALVQLATQTEQLRQEVVHAR